MSMQQQIALLIYLNLLTVYYVAYNLQGLSKEKFFGIFNYWYFNLVGMMGCTCNISFSCWKMLYWCVIFDHLKHVVCVLLIPFFSIPSYLKSIHVIDFISKIISLFCSHIFLFILIYNRQLFLNVLLSQEFIQKLGC